MLEGETKICLGICCRPGNMGSVGTPGQVEKVFPSFCAEQKPPWARARPDADIVVHARACPRGAHPGLLFEKGNSRLRVPSASPIILLGCGLEQWSLTFLAPGIYFMEDNFSIDWGGRDGFGMIQAHCIYCALYYGLPWWLSW